MKPTETHDALRTLTLAAKRFTTRVRHVLTGTKSIVPIVLALLVGVPPALAGTNGLQVSVDATPTKVSLTGTFQSYAAYKVKISNPNPSGISNVYFKAAAVTAIFQGSTLPSGSCKIDDLSGGTAITCLIGSVNPGQSIDFVVVFYAPTTSSSSSIALNWTVPSGQGISDPNPASSQTAVSGATTTTLTAAANTLSQSKVSSYLLVGGSTGSTADGTLGTGIAGNATTKVKVPSPAPVTIQQDDTTSSGSCSPHYLKCFQSTLTIQNADLSLVQFGSPFMQITLVRGSATLKNGAKISNATLQYSDGVLAFADIKDCSLIIGGVPTSTDKRCISTRIVDLATGNWVFLLLAIENGVISW